MIKHFGDWYRLVDIEPATDMLTKRWAGVQFWTKTLLNAPDHTILDTVRIFQGMEAGGTREQMLDAFQNADAAFSRLGALEHRVLAGATLANLVAQPNKPMRPSMVIGAALASSQWRAAPGHLNEIRESVLAGVRQLAESARQRRQVKSVAMDSKTAAGVQEAIKQLNTAADWTVAKPHFASLTDAWMSALTQTNQALMDTAHNLRSADEETDLLWWLEGGHSRDLNQPWSTLGHGIPVLAGCELADLTYTSLGQRDVDAFLQRTLALGKDTTEEQTLETFVNAVPEKWLKERMLSHSEADLDLTPLTLALSQRAKGDSSSWQTFYEATVGIAPSRSWSPSAIARQSYMEAFLLRLLSSPSGA